MKTVAVIFSFVAVVLLVAVGVLRYYDNEFPFGRMWETPAVRSHEKPLFIMESGIVPYHGGEAIYRAMEPEKIQPEIDLNNPEVIAKGKVGYDYYCQPCHGKNYDGAGTVGQSFAPLPGDLKSAKVQTMPLGLLFKEISYGIEGGRQPPLFSTIDMETRWRIIAYVKSLGVRK